MAAERSSTKLFVGNLPFSATKETLENLFSPHGKLIGVKLVTDQKTRRPKGFGFVTFESSAAADTALDVLRGFSLEGRTLTVKRAVPRGTGSLKDVDSDAEPDEDDTLLSMTRNKPKKGARKKKNMTSWSKPTTRVPSEKPGDSSENSAPASKNAQKPDSPGVLVQRVNALLKEREKTYQAILKASPLSTTPQRIPLVPPHIMGSFLRSVGDGFRSVGLVDSPHAIAAKIRTQVEAEMKELGWDVRANQSVADRPPHPLSILSWLQSHTVSADAQPAKSKAATVIVVGGEVAEKEESNESLDRKAAEPFMQRLGVAQAALMEEYGDFDPNWKKGRPGQCEEREEEELAL